MRPRLSPLPCLLIALARLPAATFIGEGDLSDWSDPSNWADAALPTPGEAIVIQTTYADTFRLGEGSWEPLDVVLAGSRNLTMDLAEGTVLGSVTTLNPGYHGLGGGSLGGTSYWNLAGGSAVVLERLGAGAHLELVSGNGVLLIGPQDAGGVTPATVVARSGIVQFNDENGPSHDGIEMVLAGGQMTFTWNFGRLGALRIEDAHTSTEGWGVVTVGRLSVVGMNDRDLGQMPTLIAGETELRVLGTVTLGHNLETGLVVAEVGGLDLGGAERSFGLRLENGRVANGSLAGDVRVMNGTLACATTGAVEVIEGSLVAEGLAVDGSLRVEASHVSGDLAVRSSLILGGETSAWDGSLLLGEGSTVLWVPRESEATVVELVTGTWTLAGPAMIEIGETDWSSAYWDSDRTLLLVDAWEGASVAGAFALWGAEKADEGSWALAQGEDGDLRLAWTALGATAVPEPSHLGALGALATLAISARRRRAPRR